MPVAPYDLVDLGEPQGSHSLSRGRHARPRRPILYIVTLTIVGLLGIVLVAGRFGLWGVRALSVESGSMEPAIRRYSVVLTTPVDTPAIGSVITYEHPLDPEILITHRVVGYEGEGDDLRLVTKGDANNAPDGEPVRREAVVGQVRMVIPWLGLIVDIARSEIGFIVLIIIPATIIVHNEILRLRDLLAERRREKKGRISGRNG